MMFSALFSKIVARAHPRLVVDEELSQSFPGKVHTGLTKESLSHIRFVSRAVLYLSISSVC